MQFNWVCGIFFSFLPWPLDVVDRVGKYKFQKKKKKKKRLRDLQVSGPHRGAGTNNLKKKMAASNQILLITKKVTRGAKSLESLMSQNNMGVVMM